MSSNKRRIDSKLNKTKSHHLSDTVSYVDSAGLIPPDQEDKYTEFVTELADTKREETASYQNKQWIDRILQLRKKYKIHPRKAQIKKLYAKLLKDGTLIDPNFSLQQYLTMKQSRSLSGVLVIAVLMSPYPIYLDKKTGKVKQQRFSCKHNCYYCPNEPGMPRSYLSKEAAVARALRVDFDAIDQFYCRANTLKKLGHDVDKIELLVLGGTFCQFPQEYQEQFIRDLFWSANTFYDGIDDFKKKRPRKSLSEEIKIHETATKCRIIGLTLETRPDTINDYSTIKQFRDYGATRIQVGVQHTDDKILKKINRGCLNKDTIRAVRLLKNAGYKIDIHLMPNLPGSTPEGDKKMFDHLLDTKQNDLIQCDQWKVYPCQTVDFSLIQKWYNKGLYKPYSLEKLMDVVIGLKSKISPWIRLNRIFRSLPEEHITSGITMSNFRQHMYAKMSERNLHCDCIRCREVGTHIRRDELNKKTNPKNYNQDTLKEKLSKEPVEKIREYKSSGGDELFISIESPDESVLYGFVRLRCPLHYIKPADRASNGLQSNQPFLNGALKDEENYGTEQEYASLIETFPELYEAALIREAHVYGAKLNVKKNTERGGFGDETTLQSSNAAETEQTTRQQKQTNVGFQSRGFGSKLMAKAERIARERGYKRVAVIAGVGTRLFYRRKLGYKSGDTYMIKDFDEVGIGREARGGTDEVNVSYLKSAVLAALCCVIGLYAFSAFISIALCWVLAFGFIVYLNYLHFALIDYKNVNISLLKLSRVGLILISLAVVSKGFSLFLPAVDIPLITEILNEGKSGIDSICNCQLYWSSSLVLYVTGFYLLKFVYHKRVIIMVQNPMFGNDTGTRTVPVAIFALLTVQVIAYSLCQLMVINYTSGECAIKSSFGHGCRDTFESIDIWIAIIAIIFDAILFSFFCSRWYALMLIFMEEMATSLLVQFSLVIVAMVSCITDASIHLAIKYYHENVANVPFNSFIGTPAFLVDCCIMGLCLVLSFTDSQKLVISKLGSKKLSPYYNRLENLGYNLHIM